MSDTPHDEDDLPCVVCGLGRKPHHPSHPSNPYVRAVHYAQERAMPDCVLCGEPLPRSDLHAHPECKLRAVIGGIGHLTDHHYWCIEQGDPDAGHGWRDSALLVDEWVRLHGIHESMAMSDCRWGRPAAGS